jgi:hypothetical protein
MGAEWSPQWGKSSPRLGAIPIAGLDALKKTSYPVSLEQASCSSVTSLISDEEWSKEETEPVNRASFHCPPHPQ